MAALQPAGGELRGRLHVLPIRVYYEDTDAAGVVYHSNYLRFAERARTEMLRAIGIELGQVQANDNLVFVVHKGEITWRRPARLDDALTVETALTRMGRASVTLRQIIRRGAEDIVHFTVDVACMDLASARATPVPDHLRRKFEAYVSEV
ncbi:MAG: tol-pal system-associated acyl-CoA thioesterase [Rhodospirillaceae bacterium]